MKSLIELQNIINVQREFLNLAIKNDEPEDILYKKSVAVDEAIAEYIKAERYFKTEREKILNIYGDIFFTSFKDEVIDQIKCDVLKRYANISSKELEHFSTNVYIYAVMFANNIDKLKVLAIINNLNNLYVETFQEDGIVRNSVINEKTTDYYKVINQKYLKIVKEKLV